jgi:hypothetical protein
MNDVERWVNLEGPELGGIHELMDAGREVPDLTPEQAERMQRSFLKALAAQRRQRARKQKAKWALAAGLLAAAAAAAVVVLRCATPHDLPGANAAAEVLNATGASAIVASVAAAADSASIATPPPTSGSSRGPAMQPVPDPRPKP